MSKDDFAPARAKLQAFRLEFVEPAFEVHASESVARDSSSSSLRHSARTSDSDVLQDGAISDIGRIPLKRTRRAQNGSSLRGKSSKASHNTDCVIKESLYHQQSDASDYPSSSPFSESSVSDSIDLDTTDGAGTILEPCPFSSSSSSTFRSGSESQVRSLEEIRQQNIPPNPYVLVSKVFCTICQRILMPVAQAQWSTRSTYQ